MPHANIWIRKENEDRWESIKDKSAWVNAYLKKSPPNSIVLEQKLEPVGKVVEGVKPYAGPLIPDKAVNEYLDKLDMAVGLCKVHGTPLDARGRCMQKGCKYA